MGLLKRFPSRSLTVAALVSASHACVIRHWKDPLGDILADFLYAAQAALKDDNLELPSNYFFLLAFTSLASGETLETARAWVDHGYSLGRRHKQEKTRGYNLHTRALIDALQLPDPHRPTLRPDEDEETLLQHYIERNDFNSIRYLDG